MTVVHPIIIKGLIAKVGLLALGFTGGAIILGCYLAADHAVKKHREQRDAD